MKIKELTKISICIAILCVSAYISFPLPFTPALVTAQTVVVNLIALILKPKHALLAISLYMVIGMLGIPVFSGGTSGLAKILSPSGGFILGFLLAAPLMSCFKGKTINVKRYFIVTMAIGMPAIYLVGTLWMSYFGHMSILSALTAAVLPFILGDLMKCIIASLIAFKLNQTMTSPSVVRTLSHE